MYKRFALIALLFVPGSTAVLLILCLHPRSRELVRDAFGMRDPLERIVQLLVVIGLIVMLLSTSIRPDRQR